MTGFSGLAWEAWNVFQEASFYLLIGFSVAGIVGAFVPASLIYALLGKGRIRSIILASILGIPLPLCSCSVLPTAFALHKKGARRGATLAFLISTPATGADSILITYGLLGPVFAIFDPLAAFLTASVAGFLADVFGGPEPERSPDVPPEPVDCCRKEDGLPCNGIPNHSHRAEPAVPISGRFRESFDDLFQSIAWWVFIGLSISIFLAWLVPVSFVQKYLSGGIQSYLIMLFLGMPLYVCASASVPMVAVLLAKGLSPGAALVFMLAGPATNTAGMAVIAKTFGKRTLLIYLGSIMVMGLILGSFLDGLFVAWGRPVGPGTAFGGGIMPPEWILNASMILFVFLLIRALWRTRPPGEVTSLGKGFERLSGLRIRGKTGVFLVTALILVSYLSDGILVVRAGEVGLIRRFGRLLQPRLPGLHLDLPRPFSRKERFLAEEIRTISMGYTIRLGRDEQGYTVVDRGSYPNLEERIYMTGDQNLLDINSMLFYEVKDPARFRFQMNDPEKILRQALSASLVEVLARRRVDAVLTDGRTECQKAVFDQLKRTVEPYGLGVELLDFLLLDVHAPVEVHPNFREVASAAEQMQTYVLSATAERIVTLGDAGIFAITETNRFLGQAEARVREASGYLRAFDLRSDVYRANPRATREQMTRQVAETLLPEVPMVVVPARTGTADLPVWLLPRGTGAEAILNRRQP